jgi:hypothetical protein
MMQSFLPDGLLPPANYNHGTSEAMVEIFLRIG